MAGYIGNNEEGAPARAESESIDWCSPLWITDGAREVFGGKIDLDPCGNPGSLKRIHADETFMLPTNNGLKDSWTTRPDGTKRKNAYVNPPFGTYYMHDVTMEILTPADIKKACKGLSPDEKKKKKAEMLVGFKRHTIGEWMQKCSETYALGTDVIGLGPANIDTRAWQKYVEGTASAVLYIEGRLKFELIDFNTLTLLKTGPAPMACALTYWGSNVRGFFEVFGEYGAIHKISDARTAKRYYLTVGVSQLGG